MIKTSQNKNKQTLKAWKTLAILILSSHTIMHESTYHALPNIQTYALLNVLYVT